QAGDVAIAQFSRVSAVEAAGRHEPMTSDTKDVPRSGGFTVGAVAKGAAYGENQGTNDKVRLTAEKIGGADRIAEEDLEDIETDILATKREEAAGSMAKFYDQASLGTTAVGNGTTVLYNSVYYMLSNNQTGIPGGDYTANANVIATGGALEYADLNNALALVEDSDWVDDGRIEWLGHPSFKGFLRGLVNTQGDPIWREGVAGVSPDTILGYPVRWTRGARKHATSTDTPTGNKLLFVGDVKQLIVGDRSNMESAVQLPGSGVGFLTDEALMKVRMRKGFALAHPTAFAVIEKS